MKILDHREKEFPQDLEGRLNAVLNVVNTEFKLLTMLHLDDSPADASQIHSRIRETVGGGIYLPRVDNFGAYCHKSLYHIGTVAEEDIIYEDKRIVPCYRLTEAGKKYGRPIAAFTLDYVVKNNISMFSILGSTKSKGKTRSPFNRALLLNKLRDTIKLREIDLVKELKLLPYRVLNHIKTLKELGFVNFESCGELIGEKDFSYVWVEGKDPSEVKKVRSYINLAKITAKKLKELGRADHNTLANVLKYKHTRNISTILSGLEEQGFVIREGKWKSGSVLSEVSITDKGKKFVDDYLYWVMDALNDGSKLEDMNFLLERLFSNSDKLREYSRKAVNLYKDLSPYISKKSLEETHENIIEYLRQNPGKRPEEIKKALSFSSQSHYLTPLLKSGRLMKIKKGKIVRYYVNE